MKMVLIGHRGTGKSKLLERMKVYFGSEGQAPGFYDLDREIEFREGKTISQIFEELGEAKFRELESRVFSEISTSAESLVVSLGAGFELSSIPADFECLWVRRKTDSLGRIFLNRPRLNPDVSPLEEYLVRLPLRDERYRKYSTEEYLVPEGHEQPSEIEKKIVMGRLKGVGGVLTLMPHHFLREDQFRKKVRNFDVDYFELRDDLLTTTQLQKAVGLIPQSRLLISFRKTETDQWLQEFVRTNVLWDWALELGNCPFGQPPVFSIHNLIPDKLKNLASLEDHIQTLGLPEGSMIKLAPFVSNFSQALTLLQWQQKDSDHRSVLPRSHDGRWAWIRLWLKGKQKLNFFKVDQGTAADQPSLYEWLATPQEATKFAAVLGDPVFHSRSPIVHRDYFAKMHRPVFAVSVSEDDFVISMAMLSDMGMVAAAVTSPLKSKAYRWAQDASVTAKDLTTANTLKLNRDRWFAHNTDMDGFHALFNQVTGEKTSVGVWGGGGTLPVILKICPQAICFSARTGKMKLEYGDEHKWTRDEIVTMQMEGPRILVWAASPDGAEPPSDWRPEIILDLNYREDSLAREYALKVNAQYIDGLVMFNEQARAQQEFWDRQ
jgi:shikimate 5-dehydrogenase/shikimate kinase